MANLLSIRAGATALTEDQVARLTKDLVSVSGVVSKSADHWKVVEHNPQSMSVVVSIGVGFFYGISMTYHGFSDAVNNVAITANSSGNPRIDTIVAYVDKSAVPDATASNVLKFIAVAGTPAGSPTAPSGATIQSEVGAGNPYLVLANVAVANGASTIANANITDTRVDATISISNLSAVVATLTSAIVASLKLTGNIIDTNGNEILSTSATGSAVNSLQTKNSATNNPPELSAVGDDTNIDLKIKAKGTGQVHIDSGTYGTPTAYTPDPAGTVTLLGKNGKDHDIQMPAGNITIAEELKIGQTINLTIKQDGVGSRTVTWFATITWFGGTPTLSTGANKVDSFVIRKLSANTYYGWVAGQDA